jgi:hypothetical protein
VNPAYNPFDEMTARDQTSNFQVFQIGLEHVLDKDYRYAVILSRGGGLVEKEVNIGVVSV